MDSSQAAVSLFVHVFTTTMESQAAAVKQPKKSVLLVMFVPQLFLSLNVNTIRTVMEPLEYVHVTAYLIRIRTDLVFTKAIKEILALLVPLVGLVLVKLLIFALNVQILYLL